MMFVEELKAVLEALLFASGEPLTIKEISSIMGLNERETEALLAELENDLQGPHRGLQITAIAGGYRLTTKPDCFPYLEKLYQPRTSPLSKPALETLGIIAYRQPITRAEIEAIRGVKVDHLLITLGERNLIQEIGRKESPGRPILYGTTWEFLQYLGLNSLEDLPSLE